MTLRAELVGRLWAFAEVLETNSRRPDWRQEQRELLAARAELLREAIAMLNTSPETVERPSPAGAVCRRPGCGRIVAQGGLGRRRVYCSEKCRKLYWRTKVAV